MLTRVDRLFYDGGCGLCHGAVRFVMRREREDHRFRYAPLSGPTFERLVPAARRAGLPDSLIVLTGSGRLLARSQAAIFLLKRLGGIWPWVGRLLEIIPWRIRDAGYDWIARNRLRLFEKPAEGCPVPSEEARERFDP